ncbi:unnamed protein product, partial [marine sediment metagenome]
SFEALCLARKKAKFKNIHFVCADILHLPFKLGAFNGIWNLGVMEHFCEDEIVAILKEFNHTLEEDGIYMLFWPPRYGLTVIVLSAFLFIINKVLKNSLSLYPAEISTFRSTKWADKLIKQAGLLNTKVHFGVRDIFTYIVLIGCKERCLK